MSQSQKFPDLQSTNANNLVPVQRFNHIMAHGIYILTLLLLGAAHFHSAAARRVYTTGKHLSFSQIKNPRWVPHQVSTTEVYAAPFLKHKQPMPPKLEVAFEVLNDTTSILDARDNGQTVTGSSGE